MSLPFEAAGVILSTASSPSPNLLDRASRAILNRCPKFLERCPIHDFPPPPNPPTLATAGKPLYENDTEHPTPAGVVLAGFRGIEWASRQAERLPRTQYGIHPIPIVSRETQRSHSQRRSLGHRASRMRHGHAVVESRPVTKAGRLCHSFRQRPLDLSAVHDPKRASPSRQKGRQILRNRLAVDRGERTIPTRVAARPAAGPMIR